MSESPKRVEPRHTWVFPLMSAIFKAYLSVGGWRVEGRDNIPAEGAVILAPNHQSLLDPPLVGVSCGRWSFIMAKSELFKGVVGWAIEQMGSFPVRRGGADRAAFKTARRVLEQGQPLLVFPEGTRTRMGQLGRAEPGLLMIAHAAKCPVVPVSIGGTERAFSPRRPGFRFVRARITFGKPVDFSHEYAQKGGRELFEHMGEKLMSEIEALR